MKYELAITVEIEADSLMDAYTTGGMVVDKITQATIVNYAYIDGVDAVFSDENEACSDDDYDDSYDGCGDSGCPFCGVADEEYEEYEGEE